MAEFVAHQDIECVFAMSGQYGRAPRGLYYGLLLFIIVLKRQDWLTAGAAAACLTFGGSAAIHALILAPTNSVGHAGIPGENVLLPNGTSVTITALAVDLDSDATLAMVGTGFLIIVPMALWSARFKLSGAVPVLVLWICLMTVGMLASLTNLYATNSSKSGPLQQFRFCSPDYNDPLPISGNSIKIINGSWNETVWTYFDKLDKSSLQGCFYPCLEATNLLRQSGDATVIVSLAAESGTRTHMLIFAQIASAIVYVCVPLTIFISGLVLLLRFRGQHFIDWDFQYHGTSRIHRLTVFSAWAINVYAQMLIYFIFPVFICWVEWVIYYDLQSESMQVVGQWAPLVGAALAFIAAVVGKYYEPTKRVWMGFWRRRNAIHTDHIDESIWSSLKRVREFEPKTAWDEIGSPNLRSDEES